jgi:hypothetical protein
MFLFILIVGETFLSDMFPTESMGPQTFFDGYPLLEFAGRLIPEHPWENSFSGGGQGKGPKPVTKREGSQDRARREKIVIPQSPKPPKPPKKGK